MPKERASAGQRVNDPLRHPRRRRLGPSSRPAIPGLCHEDDGSRARGSKPLGFDIPRPSGASAWLAAQFATAPGSLFSFARAIRTPRES